MDFRRIPTIMKRPSTRALIVWPIIALIAGFAVYQLCRHRRSRGPNRGCGKTPAFRQEQLAFTGIHAPYDGLIIRRDRETREFVVEVRAVELPANWTLGQRAEVDIETGQQTKGISKDWIRRSRFHPRDRPTQPLLACLPLLPLGTR